MSPGFIDTHVHLTMDAASLAVQTLQSAAAKALKGLNIAREYMNYGFTSLRDLGSVDPEWPTIDLRNALTTGLVDGPRLFVAGHILSASAGHGDLRGFYASRWSLPVSAIADDSGGIRALVRREHTFGSDWIKDHQHRRVFQPRRRSGPSWTRGRGSRCPRRPRRCDRGTRDRVRIRREGVTL